MRRSTWVVLGLVATAAACGSSDGDDDAGSPDDTDDGGSTSSSGASGGASSSGGSSSGASSGASSSGSSSGASSGSSSGETDAGTDAGDAGETDAGVDAEPDAGPSFQYAKFDLNHLLLAGQSNALGLGSAGVVLDTAPRGAACTAGALEQCSGLMFSTGVFPTTDCVHWHEGCQTLEARNAFLPLVEGDRFDNASSGQLQTPASALANQAAELATTYFPGVGLADSGIRMLVSNDARSGNAYECVRKGSCPRYFGGAVPATVKKSFEDGIDQVHNAKLVAQSKGWSYAVRGVFTVHGEADHDVEANYHVSDFPMTPGSSGVGTVPSYKEALFEWQNDYQTAIVAETGQAEPVPMYVSQMTNWTWIGTGDRPPNSAVRSLIPISQLAAFKDRPEKIVLVTPTYPFPFNDTTFDKVHLTAVGSRRLGEYFGKAYAQTTFTGRPWKPLYPIQVTRNAAVVTVKYHVPAPPLVLDTVAVTDPNGKYGFRYTDDSASPASIDAVQIQGDSVIITLNKVPDGNGKRILYAYDGIAGNASGPTSGARGNLRDSDATPSRSGGAPLVNWSVAYDEPVP